MSGPKSGQGEQAFSDLHSNRNYAEMGTVARDGTRLGAEPVLADAGGPAAVPGVLVSQAAAENFPVALKLLPPRRRPQLLAVYWFPRRTHYIRDPAPLPDRLRL